MFSHCQQNSRFAHGVYIRAMLASDKTKKKPPEKIAENKMQQDMKKQNRAIKVRYIVPCLCYCKATLNGRESEREKSHLIPILFTELKGEQICRYLLFY